MTNDTIRAMPAAEEIEAMANRLLTPGLNMAALHAAENMFRTIADQMRKSEPVAWLRGHVSHTDVCKEYDEEVCPGSDCPDGKGWIPLYTTPLADAEDARRYRLLRNEAGETFDGTYIAGKRNASFAGEGWLTGEHADEVVDAAMKEDSHDH